MIGITLMTKIQPINKKQEVIGKMSTLKTPFRYDLVGSF